MPVQFAGLVQEHQAVRQRCGVFDISHMGVLRLRGQAVKDALQALVPSDLFRIGPGEACYTVLLNAQGGIRDDLIVYDRGRVQGPAGDCDEVVLVINAACAESDTAWLRSQLEPAGITIEDRKGEGVLLALQGPEAAAQLQALSGTDLSGLPRFGHRDLTLAGEASGAAAGATAFVARTGYTGEDGFELLLDQEAGAALWSQLLERGVEPCGLGARDTLRLEAAMHLYGQDMDAATTPLEAGLGWLVHLEMPADFIGREALERQTAQGVARRLVGLKLQGHRPPRLPGAARRPGGGRDHQRQLVADPGRGDRPGLCARRAVPPWHGAGGADPRPRGTRRGGEAALLPARLSGMGAMGWSPVVVCAAPPGWGGRQPCSPAACGPSTAPPVLLVAETSPSCVAAA
jgi:aminomethyltransferase